MTNRLEIVSRNFLAGQVDTHIPKGQELPYLLRFWNSRNGRGTGARRRGYLSMGRADIEQEEALANPSTGGLEFNVLPAGTPQWRGAWQLFDDYTVDFAFVAGALVGNQTIMGTENTGIFPINVKLAGAVLNVTLHSGVYTLSHTLTSPKAHCRVARQANLIVLFVNGRPVDSVTNADPADVGLWGSPIWYLFHGNLGSNPFAGTLSWWRVFNTPFLTAAGSEMHYPNPKGSEVEQYVIGRKLTHPTQDIWMDMSSHRYHGVDSSGLITNGPEIGTSAPFQGIDQVVTIENARVHIYVIDGTIYSRKID